MRLALTLLGVVVLGVVVFYGVVILASESGEVVILRTTDPQGSQHSTRLWAVDHAGAEWVRTGHPDKGWFVRIRANPLVEFERAGAVSSRRAVPVPDREVATGVNQEFDRKYGAANWIVALSGDAADRVVVRLDPAP